MKTVALEKKVAGQKSTKTPQRLEVAWQVAPAQNVAILDVTGTTDIDFARHIPPPVAAPAAPKNRCHPCAAPVAKA